MKNILLVILILLVMGVVMANANSDLLSLLNMDPKTDPFAYRKYPFMYGSPWSAFPSDYGGSFPSQGLDMGGGCLLVVH